MKKSLLTVALAALATTAFANIDLYKTNDVTLGAYGSFEGKFGYNVNHLQHQDTYKVKVGEEPKAEVEKLTDALYTFNKEGKKEPSYKAKLGLFANYKNAEGFTIGLNGRVSFGAKKEKAHSHVYSYTTNDKGVTTFSKDEAHYDAGTEEYHNKQSLKPVLHLDKAYLTLGHPQFGYVSVGKMSTVADDFAGTSSDILDGVGIQGETSGDFVVKYNLPTFTDNLALSYSFTNNFKEGQVFKDKKDPKYAYSRSHAALLTYSDNGLTFGTGFVLENLYTHNATFNNFDVVSRKKSSQTYLEVESMPYVEDLSALVSYTYTKETSYGVLPSQADYHTQTQKDYTQVGLVEVKYNCFDVVSPYVGYAFTHARTTELSSSKKYTIADKNQAYVGLASSYKFDGYAKVEGFVEGAFAKENKRNVEENTTARFRTYDRAIKVGAKVSF